MDDQAGMNDGPSLMGDQYRTINDGQFMMNDQSIIDRKLETMNDL